MAKSDRFFDSEENFHSEERKAFRKERKRIQSSDRSKFKKTDFDKQKIELPPDDPSLKKGRIISISLNGALVDSDGLLYTCSLRGLLKKEKTQAKNLIAVGDFVRFLPTSLAEGSIAYIEPRSSLLVREDIRGTQEQLIAVNVDLAVIVVSVITPPLKPALIDRYLIAAEKGGIHPLIVITKIDLLSEATPEEQEHYRETLKAYEPLKIPVIPVSIRTQEGLEMVRFALQNKCSVFAGQSGVGKSSLLNALYGLNLKTGELTEKTQKGSHTTSMSELLSLPGGGYCIDTPGVRGFSLWNFKKEEIVRHFKEIGSIAKRCRYPDCSHIEEPNCAVKRALKRSRLSLQRYESYCSLLDELTNKDLRR